MRVRELSPKSLEEAEQICVRLEAYKIADKQRLRLVGRLDLEVEQSKEEQGKPSGQYETLSDAISSLTTEVKNFSQKNTKNSNSGSFNNQRFQKNNQNYNRNQRYNNQRYNRNQRYNNRSQRFDRSNRNDRNQYAANGEQNTAYQYRGNNSDETNQYYSRNQSSQNQQNNENQGQQSTTFSGDNSNLGFSSTQRENTSSENLNPSGWGGLNPTTVDGPKIALRSMEEGYFVPAIVADMPLTFLVDTGSNVTILCKDLLDVLPQEHFPALRPVNMQLVTATDECSPFYGKAKIEFTLGNQNLSHEILFADIKNDGIIGIDFLTANRCDVLLSKDHLVLNGEKIACYRSTKDANPSCCRIALMENVQVPPGSEMIVQSRPLDGFDKDGVGIWRHLKLSLHATDCWWQKLWLALKWELYRYNL